MVAAPACDMYIGAKHSQAIPSSPCSLSNASTRLVFYLLSTAALFHTLFPERNPLFSPSHHHSLRSPPTIQATANMVHQETLKFLLLGAGAGLVAAAPAPWFIGERSHHGHKSHSLDAEATSFPSISIVPSGTGAGLLPTGTTLPTGLVVEDRSKSKTTKKSSKSKTSSTAKSSKTASASAVSSAVSATPSGASGSATAASATAASATAASGSAAAPASTSTVTATSACTFTDAASAIAGKASCSSIILSGIKVPAGTTLDMTDLADGTTVSFEGTTTFEYDEWEGPLVSFSGTGITITGASGHVLDGNGAAWWDGEGSNGGVTKPKFFYAHKLIDSTISGINILNTPVQCFSVDGASNLVIEDVTIDNSAGDVTNGGHNTDAFDIGSSTGVYISGANVKNQDDCLAINSGTDISFTGATCSGGHGISIGSVGGRDDNDVANIYISDCTITDSDNGVRIKTVSDATGSVKNVTYTGITLSNIADYGIVIEQDYENGSPTGTPTDGVPITDLTISDVSGSVTSDAAPIYILCASCSDWTWSGVSITGGAASTDCAGIPTGASC